MTVSTACCRASLHTRTIASGSAKTVVASSMITVVLCEPDERSSQHGTVCGSRALARVIHRSGVTVCAQNGRARGG
jgi:hypothetical protein